MNWKGIMMAMLVLPMVHAALTYENQNTLLFSARLVDQAEYFKASGVVISDTPMIDPHFACLRVALCNAGTVTFENMTFNFSNMPCFASFADKLSCQPRSHMRMVLKGIRTFNSGNRQLGFEIINSNIAEIIPLKEN